jgi:hypothetical protein
VIDRLLALVVSTSVLGCQGGEQGCPLFVGVVCVSSQVEAEQLDRFAGPCGARYEVCSQYDAAFTPLPDASTGSFLGDGAILDARREATVDATTDALGDAAADATDEQ